MLSEDAKKELDNYNSLNSVKNSLAFLDFVSLKHYGLPKVTCSAMAFHPLLAILAIGTVDGTVKM